MAEYQVSITLRDSLGRQAIKQYEGDFADFATAQTAAGALADDLQAVTEAEVLSYSVGQRTVYSGSMTAGSNLDEGATFSVNKSDNYKASHKVPAPIQAMRQTGNDRVDTTLAAVIAYFQNFITGGFTLSDGETVTALLSGKIDR